MRRALPLLLLALSLAPDARAAVPPNPPMDARRYLDLGDGSRLYHPTCATRTDGHGGVIAWGADGLTWRIDPNGALARLVLLPDPTAHLVDLIADGAGGYFVLAWPDRPAGVFAPLRVMRLSAPGMVAPGWPDSGVGVAGEAAPALLSGRLCSDGAAGAFVRWVDARDAGALRMRMNRVSADGSVAVNDGVLVSGHAPFDIGALAPDGMGGAVTTWREGPFGSTGDLHIWAQRVDASCAPRWGPDGSPVCTRGRFRQAAQVADDGAGGAYLAWMESGESTYEVWGTHVLGSGALAPGWTVSGTRLSDPGIDGTWPAVAADGVGGCFVVWGDGGPAALRLERIDGAGAPQPGWPAQGLGVGSATANTGTGIAFDGSSVYLVWTQGLTAFGARVPADGAPGSAWSAPLYTDPGTGPVFLEDPRAVPDGAGGAFAFWKRTEDRMIPHEVSTTNWLWGARLGPDGVVAASVSLVSAEATPAAVTIAWSVGGSPAARATVERRTADTDWSALAEVRIDGDGRARLVDEDVAPGARLGYRLRVRDADGEVVAGEAWVEVPRADLALAGARPNPAPGPFTVAFSLSDASPATLELVDLQGRRLESRAVGVLGPGPHSARLATDRRLPPGLYLLRLRQAGRTVLGRVAVTR